MKNFLICLFLFCSITLSAQLNQEQQYVNIKSEVLSEIDIHSFGQFPNIVVSPESGFDSLELHYVSPNNYKLSYLPTAGFIGDDQIVVEYFEQGPFFGIPFPNYTTINYRVKNSQISPQNDLVIISQDSTLISVLSNDESSDGGLTINRLGLVQGGTASIVGNDILFEFDAASSNAFIRYFTRDAIGNIESGIAYVTKEDDSLVANYSLYNDNKSQIRVSCSSNNYEIDAMPNNGSLTPGDEGHIWYYQSNAGYVGQDTFSFTSTNGGVLTYDINVLDKEVDRDLIRDDQYFVPINGSINFNVFDNDYRDDKSIVDYSSELVYNGNGNFSFTPNAGFEGDKNFYYKVFTGLAIQTATITIHVDDFAPTTSIDYEFDILEDHDLRIIHDAPIDSYTYSLSVSPSYGSVTIIDNGGVEVLACATLTGDNTIIYTPDPGFSGLDEFDIEYCTDAGFCEIVKIDVNVLDSNFDQCLCLDDCVYSGDSNNDGVVDMKDILDLALNLGQSGNVRQNDFSLFWTGQVSSDWGHMQMNDEDTDLKCGDADGNGYIDSEDFTAVSDNYSQVHSLVNDDFATLSTLPIFFIPPSNPVDSGEWVSLDIVIGTEALPAIDIYGTAFTLNINPDIIDSSSVVFTLNENNWLSYDSPLESMYSVPQDGQVDIAVTRVSNASTDGLGIIGTLEFIIEDELEGFKRSQLLNNSSLVKMNNIISTNAFGEYVSHPIYEDVIKFNVEEEDLEEELSLSVSITPNPTAGFVRIESETYSIDRIEILDALGRNVFSQDKSTSRFHDLDISSLQQGVYFVRITSNGTTTVKKLEKID